MHTVRQMDPHLYARALQKQSELWDRILYALGGEGERGWSLRWRVSPRISQEDVMADLEYGRD